MKVSVFGLGYVGSVSAASFAADGHEVVGVDVNADKVEAVNAGRSPIVEPGLDDLLARGVADGRIRATLDTADAVQSSEVSLLCVGTPSRKNGSLDLSYLERVSEQIGAALRDKAAYHVVVVRSTVLPGTTHDVVIPAIERDSGQEVRRRLRRIGQPRVPARRHGAEGLPEAAAHAGRAQSRGRRQRHDRALPGDRRAARQHEHSRRRDDQVHQQHMARVEGVLRERDRHTLQARSASTATTSWTSSAATRS